MHKLNKSIDGFYQNNIKKQNLQLFSIKENWKQIINKNLAQITTPYQIKKTQDKNILLIRILTPALATEVVYQQSEILRAINLASDLEFDQIKFIN